MCKIQTCSNIKSSVESRYGKGILGFNLIYLINMRYKKSLVLVIFLIMFLYIPFIPIGFWINPPTGSMEPNITDCNLMLYGPGEPEEGSVMMYWDEDGELIAHRVIDETDQGYEFKGDNNNHSDGIIKEENIHANVYYTTSLGIGEKTCKSIFKPIINKYEDYSGNTITLSSD